MKNPLALFIIAAALIVTLVVWRSGMDGQPDAESGAGPALVAAPSDVVEPAREPGRGAGPSGKIMIPGQFQFPGVYEVPVVSSLDELLERYTPEQQEQILSFYQGFGETIDEASRYATDNIFSFRTRKQLAWLVEAGFPTPDEVLLATELSDAELRRLAERGNFKAIGFYLSRLPPTAEISAGDLGRVIDMKMQFNQSGSPYAAYVAAKRELQNGQNHNALAAYQMASTLRDVRARDFAHFLSGTNPEINAGAAVASYAALTHEFLLVNYSNIQLQLNRRGLFPLFEEDDP